ncbi:LppU/SCO3897 family protein [Micromonospora sp. DT47]|uniref:LppU/SCO3897 family protein n=1 Tax=Micromonospora sp. DT47 TaxID=3393431 RepID=UPI003CED53B7
MTSEGQHRPGQEPDEVPPGAGGPTPYGDRRSQQDTGYGAPAAPDLGWAPPPPAGRPNPPAPAWAAAQDQPPAWAAAQDQPPAWGAAQVPQQGEPAQPGSWGPQGSTPQPAWATENDQPANAWAAAPAPSAGQGEPAQPGWAQAEQAEQAAAWAQPETGARGAARVPQAGVPPTNGWSPPADPTGSGGWTAPQPEQAAGTNGWGTAAAPRDDDADRSGGWHSPPQDDPARSGGWTTASQDDPARSGGWDAGAGQGQGEPARNGGWIAGAHDGPATSGGWHGTTQDDPAHSGGWNAGVPSTQDDAPRSAGRASVQVPQQPEPAADWTQPEAGARGAAQVPQADAPAAGGWSTEDDPARSGGWHAGGPSTQDDASRSGGWGFAPQDDRPQQPWAAAEEPAPSRWDAREEQQPADGWGAAPAQDDQRSGDQQGQEWPGAQEPARAGAWGGASVLQQDDRPDQGGWTPPEQPARATASAAAPGGPPAWGTAADNPPQWAGAERPAVPDAEPWAPGQAWGRTEAGAAQHPAEDAWEPQRAEEPPVYQPGAAPGISPANAVPLPPQEQRVPGASLTAAPLADYTPPAQFGGPAEQPAFEPNGREGAGTPTGYEPERSADPSGWGPAEEPPSPAGPVVPGPRTSPESEGTGRASVPAADAAESAAGAAGRASASASVPLASRVMPPTDQALRPGGTPAPQARVYGRPARPEPVDEPVEEQPEHAPQPRFDEQDRSRFDDQGRPRFDDQDRNRFDDQDRPRFDDQDRSRFDERPDAPHAFGEAPSSAPPAFPGAIPAFADPAGNNRPMNGVRPHGSAERPAEPFGGPAAGGPPPGGVPGYGHPAHDPAHGGFASPFPPAGQPFPHAGQPFPAPGGQSGPGGWHQEPAPGPEQGRFEAFRPEAEPKTEQPAPKIRNGRVLAIVLVAAVLILAVPLGLLSLLGKIGGDDDKPAAFAVGSCVKQSGNGATEADCGEQGAFTVVSRVDAKEKCADPAQPHVVLPGSAADRVLCLKPAGK